MKLSQSIRRWMLLFVGIPLLSTAFAPTTTTRSNNNNSQNVASITRRYSTKGDGNENESTDNPSRTLPTDIIDNDNDNGGDGDDDEKGPQQENFFAPPTTTTTTTTDPFEATGEQELMTTLGGGTALMFEMIRKSLLEWKPQGQQPHDSSSSGSSSNKDNKNDDDNNSIPRWRPYSGVSDDNTSFRTEAPPMNNEGFARSMWRNLRKRDKPSLWRNALRTYDRMATLEAEGAVVENSNRSGNAGSSSGSSSSSINRYSRIRRSNIHYEAAMLACAKLGEWQRALEIYHYVNQTEQDNMERSKQKANEKNKNNNNRNNNRNNNNNNNVIRNQFAKSQKARTEKLQKTQTYRRGIVKVSDDMIFSLVKACVRASFQRSRQHREQQQKLPSPELEEREAVLRRIPLDTALEVLSTMEETHNIPVQAHYVNPLAKAYQSLGYVQEARDIIQTMLSNRTAGEEPEDGTDVVNVYDFSAKDKGSYSLLVQGSVVTGDWGAAVQALGEMIDAGLYPNKRHSNIWREISERQTRPRAVGSRKKKRDDYWTDSVI